MTFLFPKKYTLRTNPLFLKDPDFIILNSGNFSEDNGDLNWIYWESSDYNWDHTGPPCTTAFVYVMAPVKSVMFDKCLTYTL